VRVFIGTAKCDFGVPYMNIASKMLKQATYLNYHHTRYSPGTHTPAVITSCMFDFLEQAFTQLMKTHTPIALAKPEPTKCNVRSLLKTCCLKSAIKRVIKSDVCLDVLLVGVYNKRHIHMYIYIYTCIPVCVYTCIYMYICVSLIASVGYDKPNLLHELPI